MRGTGTYHPVDGGPPPRGGTQLVVLVGVERIKDRLTEVRGNLIEGEAVREPLSGEPASVNELASSNEHTDSA